MSGNMWGPNDNERTDALAERRDEVNELKKGIEVLNAALAVSAERELKLRNRLAMYGAKGGMREDGPTLLTEDDLVWLREQASKAGAGSHAKRAVIFMLLKSAFLRGCGVEDSD